ncbi:MAG: outer membrane lipoprotein chaperone LolA [Magnetococcales bacterium]|nr:outer membrane lipoprotein chaperone LolA [Magnetococcales bacterium]
MIQTFFPNPLPNYGQTVWVINRSARFITISAMAVFIWLMWPSFVGAQQAEDNTSGEAKAAFTRLQSFISGMHTMEADFLQRVVNPAQGTPEESKGRFYASRPGKFRWDYLFPFVQNIVSDGKEIFFYEPDLKQVSIANWSRLNDSPASFFVSNEPLETVFDWSVYSDPVFHSPAVHLKPKKAGEVQYIDVVLSPENDSLIRLSILDTMGNLSHFHFYKSRINADIPPDRFQFKVPEGVDIVRTNAVKQ